MGINYAIFEDARSISGVYFDVDKSILSYGHALFDRGIFLKISILAILGILGIDMYRVF